MHHTTAPLLFSLSLECGSFIVSVFHFFLLDVQRTSMSFQSTLNVQCIGSAASGCNACVVISMLPFPRQDLDRCRYPKDFGSPAWVGMASVTDMSAHLLNIPDPRRTHPFIRTPPENLTPPFHQKRASPSWSEQGKSSQRSCVHPRGQHRANLTKDQ